MRWPPFKMGRTDRERLVWILFGLMTVFSVPMCRGTTNPSDVNAINSLYSALDFPLLPGWSSLGGDPCGDGWQGVQCVNANITGIVLNGANLGGALSNDLGDFSAIIQIDLGNNRIGGSIPSSLPITIRSFFLSGNQFTGSIPATLSTLGQLTDLSFNDNHLTGGIPDAFQTLTGLINLDLSSNNLSSQLPPSMGSLSSLTTLHLQNNQLIGRLNVLQDLPLTDLDIENNQFWGPIPDKLLNIPNFRRTGNPFNTSVIPSPPALPPLPPPSSPPSPSGASGASSPSGAPSPTGATSQLTPGIQALGPSAPGTPNSSTGLKSLTTNRVTWIAIAGLIICAVLGLTLCFCVPKCCKRSQPASEIAKSREMDAYNYTKAQPKIDESFSKLYSPMEKGHSDAGLRPPIGHGKDLRIKPEAEKKNIKTMTSISKHKEDHEIDMTLLDVDILALPPPPPPPPFLSVDKVTVNPIFAPVTMTGHSNRTPNSVRSFTIASLQQFTNSFSQANLIGGGMLGTVYRAELPIGKLLAVKKLDAAVCRKQSNEDFLELVSAVSKLQHPNVVELVGYCAEHGQQLLVFEYCENGTLHEALHLDDEIHKKLSWNTRIRLALGAATALEYLHEVCQPAIVHKNFKSANILLDDKLVVHISDCGLAPLISSVHISQMSGYGYGAPEVELGSYTSMSDVYSFGVVMLEILTGRKSYDRSRPHGEQHLVRWAIPQLHDIDALSRMVDPSLNGAYPSKSLSRFADIISLCLQPEPEFRPPISEIVQNLLNMV
ncbi:protein STRUBBELIG-RECEPTOR FAMILY 3-like isoform X1 [Rhododendron vialii]|uniref:protein STRUBBELIG-RECEPTOR FAMILY 3-like isoform X1 n=1 Tax=Rhododendron vialii TaxID=182163 RepID=UPI00265D9424|nr:protein STRUBBELIG-RECEPTOR FAMILY 3-like isoform X1 [Rhododendron vialii]XP_058196730.1 protein STRUBBELIG-RECEPTOR FAMILY 3-like isoform X1 [Rhododendron vialii]XP_058196731.1 protein STRUBBELIG-RECEPTOR FAMILY 3-like isoform X1 [Rhododendron vialii]XP_058196732.1 protein STRUBBELIG-RECEPTOR FAMILY 3-like isoform X1 [Rhododendron vialii]